MRKLMALVLISFTAGLAGMCPAQEAGGEERPVFIDGVAAYVNGHTITFGNIVPIIHNESRRLHARYSGEELAERLRAVRKAALDLLIEKYLIVDSYEEQKLKIPDWVVDRRVTEIIRDNFGGDKSGLMDALDKDGISYQEWWEETRQFIIVEVMKDTCIGNVSVSPEEIRREYETGSGEYKVPGRVELSMIFISKSGGGSDAVLKAGRILNALKEGADFGDQARRFSEGEHAEEGGRWGWIEPSILKPVLAGTLEGMIPGQVSEIIDTEDGLYILKVEDREEERTASLEEMQVQIGRKLRAVKMKEMHDAWMDRLKKDAYIKFVEIPAS